MIFAGTAAFAAGFTVGFAAGFAAFFTVIFVAAFAAFRDVAAFAVFALWQAGDEAVLPVAMPQQAGIEAFPADGLTAWRLA